MYNIPEWLDTLEKSCSICYKIFNVCLTILEGHALEGLPTRHLCAQKLTIKTVEQDVKYVQS